MLSEKLLAVLACPKCKGKINYDKGKNILVCSSCRLKYKILKDIPDMLLADAEKI